MCKPKSNNAHQEAEMNPDSFRTVKTIREAIGLAKRQTFSHQSFQHYTTLDALLSIVKHRSMWLTRGTSVRLDDSQEREKFGTGKTWKKTYIASFSYGRAESAAMWGLYCKGDPKAVRITITAKAMQSWMDLLEKLIHERQCVSVNPRRSKPKWGRMKSVQFADLVYAAVNGRGYDEQKRSNVLAWNGDITSAIKTLGSEIHAKELTGLLKDYEWAFENESRLIVTMARSKQYGSRISVPIPDEVFKTMRVRFGPWASSAWIESAKKKLHSAFSEIVQDGWLPTSMCSQSVLHGALRKWGVERNRSLEGKNRRAKRHSAKTARKQRARP